MDELRRQRCGRRGVGNFRGPAPLPAEPTATAPGSPERLAVMAERARRGEQLRHPHDATFAQAEATTAPRKLTERLGITYAADLEPMTPPAKPAPEQSATSSREVPGLTLHRGARVWKVGYKIGGRRVVRYFGRDFHVASARYREWAKAWPAPLLGEVPPVRDRARVIDTPDGPARLHEAARTAGIRPGTLAYRLDVLRWPVAAALATPTRRADAQEPFRTTREGGSCHARAG
jgi:hypothetical protein